VKSDKRRFAEAFVIFEKESNRISAARLVQNHGDNNIVVNPPYKEITTEEIDQIYDLPFTHLPHPKYNKKPPVPAFEMIRNSVNIHRGCFGGCSFCAIAAHQGKQVISRSEESVMKEVETLSKIPGFNGVLTDLGGPSANMYNMKGKDMKICDNCSRPSCIWPAVCNNLNTDHKSLLTLYRKVRELPAIKKVFIGSGVRYDLLLSSFNKRAGRVENEYLGELLKYHVSGRFKVAPEHTSDKVLGLMRKPSFELYRELKDRFDAFNRREGKRFQLIPYFISSHPGTGRIDMARLAVETKKLGLRLEQVQGFTPTPMTLSTTIYYTGIDPYSGKKVEVAKSADERRLQNSYFFWYKEENVPSLKRDLAKLGRDDISSELFGTEKIVQKRRRKPSRRGR
jgi:uncharacterized radical SAM protein YgiQ